MEGQVGNAGNILDFRQLVLLCHNLTQLGVNLGGEFSAGVGFLEGLQLLSGAVVIVFRQQSLHLGHEPFVLRLGGICGAGLLLGLLLVHGVLVFLQCNGIGDRTHNKAENQAQSQTGDNGRKVYLLENTLFLPLSAADILGIQGIQDIGLFLVFFHRLHVDIQNLGEGALLGRVGGLAPCTAALATGGELGELHAALLLFAGGGLLLLFFLGVCIRVILVILRGIVELHVVIALIRLLKMFIGI